MGKFLSDNALDQGLAFTLQKASRIIACAGQPTNYAEATDPAKNYLGNASLTASDKQLGFTATGRKLVLLDGIEITFFYSGNLDHLALVNDQAGSEELIAVTEVINNQAVVAGSFMVTPIFEISADRPI